MHSKAYYITRSIVRGIVYLSIAATIAAVCIAAYMVVWSLQFPY